MGTPNKQNNLAVKSPKYSIFPCSGDHKFSMQMGRIYSLNEGYELMPGDELNLNIQQLTRFMPMLSPVLQRYIIDYIPVFVPYRLLWSEDAPIWNSNKFFNPATPDSERPAIPMTSWKQIFSNRDGKIFGSIFDFLGYPTMTGLYNALQNCYINTYDEQPDRNTGESIDSLFIWSHNPTSADEPRKLSVKYLGSVTTVDLKTVPNATGVLDYRSWLIKSKGCNIIGITNFDDMIKQIPGSVKSSAIQDEYVNYLFTNLASSIFTSTTKDLSLLPWLCYHKAISDWFVRTDMIDPDEYMGRVKAVCNILSTQTATLNGSTAAGLFSSSQISMRSYILGGSACPRLWMDDYFTTAMTSLQVSSAANVMIPVNGTIQQLWTANRLEQFRMRIQLAGKRFMDQIYQLFGVKVPDARLQRTEVLGHCKFNVVVSDVLQTSQSDIDSSLGQFAGQAMSSSGTHLLHYKADEPGLVLVLTSVRPTTSYVDRTPRSILKKDYYDFCNPMFDNVGIQAIMNNEICYRPGDTSVFGYTPRRYAEYMTGPASTIHGLMKTSMDYWHAGRKFNVETSVPALNNDFITMDDADSLNRIFADQVDDNIVCQVYVDGAVTRPLSRYVNYHM